jgi:hypothetical protein
MIRAQNNVRIWGRKKSGVSDTGAIILSLNSKKLKRKLKVGLAPELTILSGIGEDNKGLRFSCTKLKIVVEVQGIQNSMVKGLCVFSLEKSSKIRY